VRARVVIVIKSQNRRGTVGPEPGTKNKKGLVKEGGEEESDLKSGGGSEKKGRQGDRWQMGPEVGE